MGIYTMRFDKLVPFFNKKPEKNLPVTKSAGLGFPQFPDSFEIFGYSAAGKMQWHEVTSQIAWNYYKRVSVVYNAVDIIAQSFAIIEPRIWDNDDERFLTHDDKNLDVYQLIEKLEMPEFGLSYVEFARQMITNYIVTGDLYVIAIALNETSPIQQIKIINSQNVTVTRTDKWGYAVQYMVDLGDDNITFTKDKNGRFYGNVKTQELWHTKMFNPTSKTEGLSPLSPIYYEIEQFIAASIHNGNLLKQGARPSGILTINPHEYDLNDENYRRLRDQINLFYKGEQNAGNILILQGGKEFKQLSLTNKDMDFALLKKSVMEQIYRNLKIPLSLILSESMTLDNFKMAIPVLYKMAILPIADILFGELNLFLMHRYDDTGRYELTYNKRDIDALDAEFNIEVDRLIKTQLLTINEGRALLDLMPLEGTAGDEIFAPSALVPIGMVQETKKYTEDEYRSILKKHNFTESQIAEYIDKYYSGK